LHKNTLAQVTNELLELEWMERGSYEALLSMQLEMTKKYLIIREVRIAGWNGTRKKTLFSMQ
jgi:hypothetical protein